MANNLSKHVSVPTSNKIDVIADELLKKLGGTVKKDTDSTTLVLGSRIKWKLIGYLGQNGSRRTPIRIKISVNNHSQNNQLDFDIVYSPGSPEFLSTNAWRIISKRLDEIEGIVKEVNQNL